MSISIPESSAPGAARARIPVAVLTGFLGSGKTTLLSRVLAEPAMQRVAVIINEFGAVSLDHRLVARSTENIVELRNGCVCCNIRGDLVMTLRDLHQRRALGEIPRFDYVIVETSGLADPVPLLHTLIANPPVRQYYYPDAVIACADAEHLAATLAEHDCGERQIAMADVVLLTKGDRVGAEALQAVRRRVASLNPWAEIVPVEHGHIAADRLFRRKLFEPREDRQAVLQWLQLDAEGAPRGPRFPLLLDRQGAARCEVGGHGGAYRSQVLTAYAPISLAGAVALLNRLVNLEQGEILRIKGILWTRERPQQAAVVHAVRDKFYPIQWLDEEAEDRRSHLVVIARSLDAKGLEAAFEQACLH